MKRQWNLWLNGILGVALALPMAGFALAQDSADDNRPRAERQNDDGAREDKADPEERDADREERNSNREERNADREERNVERDARDIDRAEAPVERQPRSIRNDRLAPRDNVDVRVQEGSPSDLQAAPAPIQPQPMQHQGAMQHRGQVYASGNNCCCGSGNVVYSNGYQSARAMNNGGYRSYSYQGGDAAMAIAPAAPVYVDQGYNAGYGYRSYNGVQNGANWDRFNEHDSRNFSGSYGSRASLRSR
jgi:hypothetical protein